MYKKFYEMNFNKTYRIFEIIFESIINYFKFILNTILNQLLKKVNSQSIPFKYLKFMNVQGKIQNATNLH